MSEFIGRTGSHRVYSYPDRRGGNPAELFARNFAAGPLLDTDIETGEGTPVPWAVIESGAPAGINVPITPRSTGRIRISGAITVKSVVGVATVSLFVQTFDGVTVSTLPIPLLEENTISAAGFEVIPFLTENIGGALLPIGVPTSIRILLIASESGLSLLSLSSTIDIQEVLAATG